MGRSATRRRCRFLNEGGKLLGGRRTAIVKVADADAMTLLVVAATNFKSYNDLRPIPQRGSTDYLDHVQGKAYDQLARDHIAEHQRLFRRVKLSLPETAASSRPTDVSVSAIRSADDPQLAALMFQYGRYLLIGSSRPGVPAGQSARDLERRHGPRRGTASSRRTSTQR